MATGLTTTIQSLLCWWAHKVLRFPKILIVLIGALSMFSLYYTVNNLGFNMDTSELLSQDLPFQQNRKLFDTSFPDDADNIIILIEAETAEHSILAARSLYKLLSQNTDYFSSVGISHDDAFFRQQALLYMDTDKLEDLSTRLSEAQPFIGYLAQNYSLRGLFELIGKALNANENELPVDLTPLLEKIDHALIATIQQKPYFISWQKILDLTPSTQVDQNRHIVIAKPIFDFSNLLPSEPAMDYARKAVIKVKKQFPDTLRISITGGPAVEHEELESLGNDMVIAGLISLALVCCSLWVGLRSFKLMLVTLIALVFGLFLTAGYATLVVGHLNVLSVAFAVLYIGLGVDFSLHVCLRFKECLTNLEHTDAAIRLTVKDIGFSLFLCALTTSIGFFAFIPTNYAGVSELGIISGGGMFIGFFIAIMAIPALLKLMPTNQSDRIRHLALPHAIYQFPFKHKKSIQFIALFSSVLAFSSFTQLSFDSNPINLRNQASDSVIAFHELLKAKADSPFVLFSLRNDLRQAELLAQQLKSLPSVSDTVTLLDLVPDQQDKKLEMIDDLNLLLGSDLEQFQLPFEPLNNRETLIKFKQDLTAAQHTPHQPSIALLTQLQQHIDILLALRQQPDNLLIRQLDDKILSLLPFTMQQLSISLSAYQFALNDIPENIRNQWQSTKGIYKILIVPKYDLNDPDNLEQFVQEVQKVDPGATGYPVIDSASGKAVAEAFIQAFISALLAIFFILLFILKSFRNTLLVLCPLLLATLLTGSVNVLLHNPFNFANSIAIPLLMGMGVDSGIHIMHRLHTCDGDNEKILQTSTARGVFFSSLTTLFSFTSLAFIPHAGIASMGLLLSIGISFTLLCTLIVLPAFSEAEVQY